MRALGKESIASFIRAGLEIAWWLLIVASALWALCTLGYIALLVLAGQGLVDPSVFTDGSFSSGGANLKIEYDTPHGITWPVAAPGLVAAAVVIAGGLVIIGRLKQLFTNFTYSEPFHRQNAQHLRVIWIAMAALELSRYAIHAVTAALMAAFHPPAGREATFTLEIDISTWFSILVLIVLAEVFREGARLREEQDLTI